MRILASAAVSEPAAEPFEAILEACRVIDWSRDEREVLVAHSMERFPELEGGGMVIGSHGTCCDTVEGPVGKPERDTVQHEAEKTPVGEDSCCSIRR